MAPTTNFRVLQEAATVMHLARSGRLILRANSPVKDGSILVDEKGRKTCKVIETIGPVSGPYFSAQPLADRIGRVAGEKLFLDESQTFQKKGGFKSRARRDQRHGPPSNRRF
jgi:rRNA processing protein Gar1